MGLVEVIGYCAFVEGGELEDGTEVPDRYMAQLVQRKGRRAGDATGVLGKARELNLTEWVETIAKEYGEDTSDIPFAPDFDPEESARIDAETAAAEAAAEADAAPDTSDFQPAPDDRPPESLLTLDEQHARTEAA